MFRLVFLALGFICSLHIYGSETSINTKVEQTFALGEDDTQQSLFNLTPRFDVKFNSRWRGKLELTLEHSGGNVGLGTRSTYDDISRPAEFDNRTRAILDSATLTWRKRSTRVTVGKQTFAWGILDGIQITDRLDATSKRQAVFIEQRPDRLSRWGLRSQFKFADLHWDTALILDNSADELASQGSNYEAIAPRFRAGFSGMVTIPELTVHLATDPTVAIKASRRSSDRDLSLVMINGPETEPVFRTTSTGIALSYINRTLIGGTYQQTRGNQVWRFELASVLNQPVNIQSPMPVIDKRERYLAGVGIDWRLKNNIFVNLQVAADVVSGEQLVRPKTDLIATTKIQRTFRNDTVALSLELLSSLKDSNGTLRPGFTYQVDDVLTLKGGIDWVWGDRDTLFGQFAERDRAWFKVSWSF